MLFIKRKAFWSIEFLAYAHIHNPKDRGPKGHKVMRGIDYERFFRAYTPRKGWCKLSDAIEKTLLRRAQTERHVLILENERGGKLTSGKGVEWRENIKWLLDSLDGVTRSNLDEAKYLRIREANEMFYDYITHILDMRESEGGTE